jgi:hypothetical protein
MGQRRKAPFTPSKVANLNDYQKSEVWHPLDCPDERCVCRLVAAEAGWLCPACGYTQDWAPQWMANGAWRGYHEILKREA